MDTTLPLPFLPAVDLAKSPTDSIQGLTSIQLSYLGSVYLVATEENIEVLFQFLQKNVSVETHVDVTAIGSSEDIVSILDAGARKIFVNSSQREPLKSYGDRVVSIYQKDVSTYTSGVVLDSGEDASACRTVLELLKASKTSPVFLTSTTSDLESFVRLASEFSAVPIIPATKLTLEKPEKGQVSVPALIGGSWISDRVDKLVPTVVTDERGISLGLVYSSQQSLAESLKTGTGVYQSRKRGLWYKGATSGDTQELLRISLDCDQDCLKFVVRQNGRGKSEPIATILWTSLICVRLLSPTPINLLWRISRTCEVRKDIGVEKEFCTGRLVHSTFIFGPEAAESQNNGRSRGALRS